MADINNVVIVGRLVRDAELKYTNGGMAITKLSMAVSRRKKNGDRWEDEAHFFDATVWGKQGESLAQYLTKGKQVGIEGELRQDRWEQDGQKRSRVYISADNVQLLGGNSGNKTTAGRDHNGTDQSGFNDDIPW